MINWHARHRDGASLGDRISDQVTGFMGSWTFVIAQTVVMTLWVLFNVWAFAIAPAMHLKPFDPYPFVFLNLFMSAEAAYATPLIMMSQNRADARDRVHAEHDYIVNKLTLALLRRICSHFDVRLDHVEDELRGIEREVAAGQSVAP